MNPEAIVGEPSTDEAKGWLGRVWRVKPAILVALFLLLVMLGPALAPYSPLKTSGDILSPPSASHPMGTDSLGRDVLSRVMAGGTSLVELSLAAGLLAVLLGASVGLVAGYKGGSVDGILMRGVDVLLTIPPMLLALLAVAALPRNRIVLVTLVAILLSPGAARIMRGISMQIASRDFISAAEAAGESTLSILGREMLPNVRGRLAVEVALRTGFAMLVISALNFLGLGISPPTPDWGLMVSEERFSLSIAPWSTLFPAAAIFLTIVITNAAADWLERRWR